MNINLLTEYHLEFLSLKGGCIGSSELHLSKRHIVGNHMSRLIYYKEDGIQIGPRRGDTTCIRGFQQGHAQTSLLSSRD